MDYQSSFPIDDEDNPRPIIAIVMDDISGSLKRNKLTTHLSSRYRHFSIGQLIYINQTLKDLPAICRTTAENVFVAKTTSILEQQKILDEWSDLYEPFYADFGPLDLGKMHLFCKELEKLINDK